MFNFLKKKEGVPDVGQEDAFEEKEHKKKKADEIESSEEDIDEIDVDYDSPKNLVRPGKKGKISDGERSLSTNDFELNRINAKIESLSSLIKAYNERFSNISQQIGELRAMNLNNEKSISKATQEALKTVDIVKEVKPDKLRIDYQKMDFRLNGLIEKIESNKQFMDTIMEEIKDLRRKAGIFVGTDALLKLNEDVKQDLVEIQKTASRVKLNADKSEELFIELKKGFAENQKLNEVFINLDNSYSGLTKEIEKLKLDFSKIINEDDFNLLKKNIDSRIIDLDNSVSKALKIKEENEKLAGIIETMLHVIRKNKEDIGQIALAIGDSNIDSVNDYDKRFALMLKLIDHIAEEVKEIKESRAKQEGQNFLGIDKERMKKWKMHKQELGRFESQKKPVEGPVKKAIDKVIPQKESSSKIDRISQELESLTDARKDDEPEKKDGKILGFKHRLKKIKEKL
jgi:hypothetical protein